LNNASIAHSTPSRAFLHYKRFVPLHSLVFIAEFHPSKFQSYLDRQLMFNLNLHNEAEVKMQNLCKAKWHADVNDAM
jgi:hypothetical protein